MFTQYFVTNLPKLTRNVAFAFERYHRPCGHPPADSGRLLQQLYPLFFVYALRAGALLVGVVVIREGFFGFESVG